MAVVLVSHDLASVARVADRVFLLDGRLLTIGTPAELLASPVARQRLGMVNI
jgi:ABC-type proline/glycine betaine transport system ATPase subunit